MSVASDVVRTEYLVALQDYLAGAGERALEHAYQLGRQAMVDGLGVLDVTTVHHEALLAALQQPRPPEERDWVVKAAGDFLIESLSPFEFTHRGYQEANTMRRHALQFAAVVCHELRTPLTSIQASAGMLQEILGPAPAGTVERLLTNILGGASALNGRMNDLVDMAGFQSGNLSMRMEDVDAGQLLRQICQRLEPVVQRAGLDLHYSIPADLPIIRADPRRLEQVASNLVQNAIKFGFGGDRIDIRARVLEGHLVIEVQDYGRGIAAEDQERLFQAFVRVEPESERMPGLGIGLALCRQLVEAHKGRIWVSSDLEKGAVFKFALPLDGTNASSEEAL